MNHMWLFSYLFLGFIKFDTIWDEVRFLYNSIKLRLCCFLLNWEWKRSTILVEDVCIFFILSILCQHVIRINASHWKKCFRNGVFLWNTSISELLESYKISESYLKPQEMVTIYWNSNNCIGMLNVDKIRECGAV